MRLTGPARVINVDGSWNARLRSTPAAAHALQSSSAACGQTGNTVEPVDPHPRRSQAITVFRCFCERRLFLPRPRASLREEGQRLIAESFRVLAPGGILRIVVPDLRAIVEEYLGNGPLKSQRTDQKLSGPPIR